MLQLDSTLQTLTPASQAMQKPTGSSVPQSASQIGHVIHLCAAARPREFCRRYPHREISYSTVSSMLEPHSALSIIMHAADALKDNLDLMGFDNMA